MAKFCYFDLQFLLLFLNSYLAGRPSRLWVSDVEEELEMDHDHFVDVIAVDPFIHFEPKTFHPISTIEGGAKPKSRRKRNKSGNGDPNVKDKEEETYFAMSSALVVRGIFFEMPLRIFQGD